MPQGGPGAADTSRVRSTLQREREPEKRGRPGTDVSIYETWRAATGEPDWLAEPREHQRRRHRIPGRAGPRDRSDRVAGCRRPGRARESPPLVRRRPPELRVSISGGPGPPVIARRSGTSRRGQTFGTGRATANRSSRRPARRARNKPARVARRSGTSGTPQARWTSAPRGSTQPVVTARQRSSKPRVSPPTEATIFRICESRAPAGQRGTAGRGRPTPGGKRVDYHVTTRRRVGDPDLDGRRATRTDDRWASTR